MSSHARHGSAPRPTTPYQDQPYPESGYDGHDGHADHRSGYEGAAYGAQYAAPGYAGEGYEAYGSYAAYETQQPYQGGAYADSGYVGGGYAGGGYAEAEHGSHGHGAGYGYSDGDHASAGYAEADADHPSALSADAPASSGAASASTASGSAASGSAASRSGASRSGASGSAASGAARPRGSRASGAAGAGGSRAPRPSRAQARAAARAQARRKRLMRTSFLGVGSVAAVAVIAVAGFMTPHHDSSAASAQADRSAVPVAGRTGSGDASRSVDRATPAAAVKQLPGLGAGFLAKIPANAQQVLLVTGKGKDQNTDTAVLWTRTAAGGWMPGPTWAARNAKDGWTTNHHAGDLHSPIGVFSLTDAGGMDPNPGTKLPYTHSSAFQAPGTGFEGESLADAFDYVVAINYNHVPGTSPLDGQRPMGAARGGGIWVHVDHGGPTHGCVALAKSDMRALLQALDPARHPVIVMGDAASLAQ